MRNLTIHNQTGRVLEDLGNDLLSTVQQSKVLCTVDPNNNYLYVLSGSQLFTIPSDRQRDAGSTKISDSTEPVGLEFCTINQQLYCAFKGGDIITVSATPRLEFEIAAHITDGLHCVKLSPDHEILTLVTTTGTVINMVSTLEVISEEDLHSSNFGEKQFVTVGWGKKETQFHGSEGKAARCKTEQIDRNESDDGLPRIIWRGDGSLFAVSFLHAQSGVRQFKVFSRSGILQYTSELVNGLEESLSWKPSGSLIATTQKLVNKHVVALFEKNGLKHREFVLPFGTNEIKVKEIFWSPDSDILAIWCERLDNGTATLQLWTENNYHWYLKRTMTFSKENPLMCAMWNATPRSGKELILLIAKELLTCSFRWTIDHSRGKSTLDKAVVGVIDGNKASLTGFRAGIVPPPMAHQSVEIEEQINEIVFAPAIQKQKARIDSNAFFCVSENNKLTFFKQNTDTPLLTYEHKGMYDIELDVPTIDTANLLCVMHHFLWLKEDTILCSVSMGNENYLCVLSIVNMDDETQTHIAIKHKYIMEGAIEHIVSCPDSEEAFLVIEGTILKYKEETGPEPMDIFLPRFCYQLEVIKTDKKYIMVSLSHRNCLSLDGKEIANNITSFYVHSEFLLLTTLQHTLICVPLDEYGIEQLTKQDLTTRPWENGLNELSSKVINVRRVERGSLLVVAISKDSRAILQMPRGNLECIQPRALSLHIIGYHLDNSNYKAAFDLMRKQRINLNLIYDHDPALFESNAAKFVEDVANPSWLSLFLSELQDEDVTTSAYASCYTRNKTQAARGTNTEVNKVERVCTLLRDIMEGRSDATGLIQPILISLVKNQNRQGLEAALRKIKQLRELEDTLEEQQRTLANDALKYLLYLVDVNVLYDIALGMYDFDLTIFVASKSQKDPKEFLPFLNGLRKLDENHMKYSIDIHLKRYESALEHISKERDRFNDCTSLIRDHNLYIKAMTLFSRDTEEYGEVARIYAEHLLSKKKFQEAGIMFQKSKNLNKALHAYKLAGSWQDVIIVAKQQNLSPADLRSLCKDLVVRLKEDRRHYEAAQILMSYLSDPEEAVASLCDCKKWKDATRIAHDVRRLDLIETHIKPGVCEHADYIMTQINTNRQDFMKHKARLVTLRTELATRKLRVFDDGVDDNKVSSGKEVTDFLSDTSSIAGSVLSQRSRSSTASGRSYRSSKNRRKQERKLLSAKEGSAFEDLGLMRALHELVVQTYKLAEELSAVVEMLINFDNKEQAEKLHVGMKNFLQVIERSKHEIWDKSAPTSLSDIEAFPSQFQEAQKLIEPRMMYPPETVSTVQLDLF